MLRIFFHLRLLVLFFPLLIACGNFTNSLPYFYVRKVQLVVSSLKLTKWATAISKVPLPLLA